MEFQTNAIFAPLLEDKKRFNFLVGGAGSGKSKFVTHKYLDIIYRYKGERILAVRKVKETVKESIFQEFKSAIDEQKVRSLFKINESNYSITCKLTGSTILTAALDDHEKIKSISGITRVWVEEATELLYDDFSQLDLRMREKSNLGNQMTLTCNPIDDTHWIKKLVESPENQRDITFHRSTFLDNAFISKDYKNGLIRRYKSNPLWWDVYILGKWGKVRKGGEFYYNFANNRHVIKGLGYDSNLPLHISFDFNVQPYMTITVWQLDGKKAMQIDELCMEHPANNTLSACQAFKTKYFHELAHTAGLFIYGDPAGRHQDTRQESGFNDFTIIMQALKDMHPTLRITDKAPPVKMRGDFINAILGTNYADIHLYFSDKCILSTNDLSYLKQAPDGTKLKEKEKNTVTGVAYEKYGHTSDSMDYFLCQVFSEDFLKFQRGGKGFQKPIYQKKGKVY